MKDLFLSYDSENEEYAKYLARMLEEFGWSMWWDLDIEEAPLNNINCILTLFSEDAIINEQVINHARAGASNNNLLPIRIGENFDFPTEFRQFASADLTHWDGSSNHPAFTDLIDKIQALIGLPNAPQAPMESSVEDQPKETPQHQPSEPSSQKTKAMEKTIASDEAIVEDETGLENKSNTNSKHLLTIVLLIMAVTFAVWYFTRGDSDQKTQIAQEVKTAETPIVENESKIVSDTISKPATLPADPQNEKAVAEQEPAIENTVVKEKPVEEIKAEKDETPESNAEEIDLGEALSFLNKIGTAKMTLNEKAAFVENNNNSALSAEEVQQFKAYHKDIVAKSATLKSDGDFVICGGVVERQPTLIKTVYPQNSKVWPWVRANSPTEETLILKWVDLETNKIAFTTTMKVKTQTNAGWRTWSAKTMKAKGSYEVRLFNSQNIMIGKQSFQIQ